MSCCCCCLNICCMLPQNKDYFSSKRTPSESKLKSSMFKSTKNWMKSLKDDLLVSEINMPGTHDSMALYPYYGLSVSICQRWMLIDQLNSGIRFFDIRVKEDSEGLLPIYHSTSFQNAYLEANVIDVCDKFLKDNPSEFIILMIRIEDQTTETTILSTGFDKIERKKRSGLFAYDNYMPNLGYLRGKIWIWPGNNWPYKGFSVRYGIRAGCLIRQDQYNFSLSEKKDVVKELNDIAYNCKSMRQQGMEIYLNQMNGVKWNKWPSSYASEINQYVYENKLYEGILVFDFPGESLIKEVIESNFFTPKEYFLKDMQNTNNYT